MTYEEGMERLALIDSARLDLDRAQREVETARGELHEAIEAAIAAGLPGALVARHAGVSAGRVTQLAPVRKAAQARVHAQKDGADDSRVTDLDTLAARAATVSGVATVRRRSRYGRPTMFHDTRQSTDLAVILAGARSWMRAPSPGDVRVFLTGPPPLDLSTGATHAEAVRAWAFGDPGPGWTPGEHYLNDPDHPVLRFTHDSGDTVTILRAAAWWGETDADAETCAAAWAGLGKVLDAIPAFAGAGLADTPATTGRALWLRTIPEGTSYPVLSDELRELIRKTSGQGRIELRPRPKGGRFRDFTYMDGRLMYAALTWGLPVGEPTRVSGREFGALGQVEQERTLRGRGRWRVRAWVPDDWQHVGLLMAPTNHGRWEYPYQPGRTFETWADGSEVWLALGQGWRVDVLDGLTWAEGKPLNAWRDALVKAWESCKASESPAADLAAKAIRSMILYAIGAFAATSHPITRTAGLGDAGLVPTGVEVRQVGDRLVWQEPARESAWSLETRHPEWSATVWARARTRLLVGSGGQGGALDLDPRRVVGFATDAIYLAGGAPQWPDDGKPGRFRVKGQRPGAFTWPSTYADLYKLRDESEEQ